MQKVSIMNCIRRYLAAGAKVLETNTYQCALSNLVKYRGISYRAAQDVLRLGVQLARQAIESHCAENAAMKRDFFVAGSVGPYATVLHDGSEYNGLYIDTVQPELIKDYFSGQVEAVCSAGVDCLAIETLPSLREAKLAIEVASKLCNVPTWISFSCKEGCLTNYGDAFCDVITELNRCRSVAALGINCTDPKEIAKLLSCAHSQKLVVVYPNAGLVNGDGQVFGASFATYANEWLSHGAKLIGGCCFTGPQEIAEIANVVYDKSLPKVSAQS
ncbi:homocysteine S methyltransferase [Trichuris trichiura]|uniref:Homocysteine S methyltransferase n=1 Tax=Trichuris trichiura TaxID=36087 RepID=A0A077ZD27_TRITR|nr:homocysteine S methyltransferase [Trichuris trichiura]